MKSDFDLLILLRRGVYMSYTNIEEGILSSPPEVPSLDIQTGSWVSYCRVVGECLASNGCRCGSCFTLGHTRFSKRTNKSIILSWRWLMKLPLLQLNTCSTVNLSPQTQLEGRSGRGSSYLNLTPSLNTSLLRIKSLSSRGRGGLTTKSLLICLDDAWQYHVGPQVDPSSLSQSSFLILIPSRRWTPLNWALRHD